LSHIHIPISKDGIIEIICGERLANYFEIMTAVSELQADHNIIEISRDAFMISDVGENIAKTLGQSLPFSVYTTAMNATDEYILKEERSKENHVEINKTDHGYEISLTIGADDFKLMQLTILVANGKAADQAKNNFLSDPTDFYQSIFNKLTSNS